MIALLDGVARRKDGGLDHRVPHQVTQLGGPPELVGHRALVLLVLPADAGQDLLGVDGDHVPDADAGAGGAGDDGLLELPEVHRGEPFQLHVEPDLFPPDLQEGLARSGPG